MVKTYTFPVCFLKMFSQLVLSLSPAAGCGKLAKTHRSKFEQIVRPIGLTWTIRYCKIWERVPTGPVKSILFEQSPQKKENNVLDHGQVYQLPMPN
jgi:hypothetical protein